MSEKMFILGDSYSTYKGYIPEGYNYYYSDEREALPIVRGCEKTWWKIVSNKLGLDIACNDSWSGSTLSTSVRSCHPIDASFVLRTDKYIREGFFEKTPIDVFYIFGGTNDSWIDVPVGKPVYSGFDEQSLKCVLPAFSYILKRLLSVEGIKKIVVIVNTDLKEDITNGFVEIAEHYNVDCVLLRDIDKENGHPTERGMREIAEQVSALG